MTEHQDKAVALSIGDAPDRGKLGFPAGEVHRVLFTICTAFVRNGYHIWYAGDLRPGGVTLRMFEFLKGTYAGQDWIPFTNVLPGHVVRRSTFADLAVAAKAARGIAEIKLSLAEDLIELNLIEGELWVGPKANSLRLSDEASLREWLGRFPEQNAVEALTAARKSVSVKTAGRVSMGGRMGLVGRTDDTYEGEMPGIAQEAILTLEAGAIYAPLAAFGGATRDVAISLGLLPQSAEVPRARQLDSYETAMESLVKLRDRIKPWAVDRLQALAVDENAEDVAQGVLALFEARSAHAKLSLRRPDVP